MLKKEIVPLGFVFVFFLISLEGMGTGAEKGKEVKDVIIKMC